MKTPVGPRGNILERQKCTACIRSMNGSITTMDDYVSTSQVCRRTFWPLAKPFWGILFWAPGGISRIAGRGLEGACTACLGCPAACESLRVSPRGLRWASRYRIFGILDLGPFVNRVTSHRKNPGRQWASYSSKRGSVPALGRAQPTTYRPTTTQAGRYRNTRPHVPSNGQAHDGACCIARSILYS